MPWLKLLKMAANSDFEPQSCNPYSANQELQNNELDPDVNYYQNHISSLNTKYYVPSKVKNQLKNLQLHSFSVPVPYLTIIGTKKYFDFYQ